MANSFPSAKNNFVTGVNSGTLATVGHADAHNALEAKIGINNSTDTTSLDYLLKSANSKNPGHYHTNGGPVLLIAASNAPTLVKNKADYVCTGSNDDTTIQLALSTLQSSGGKLMLSEGTFVIGTPISVTMEKGLTIEGTGYGTVLQAKAALNDYIIKFTPDSNGVWARFANFKLDGNAGNQTTDGGGIYAPGAIECIFENLWFYQPYNTGLYLYQISGSPLEYGHNNMVRNCHFDNGNLSGGSGKGIHLRNCDENTIIGCDFQYMGGTGGSENLPYAIYDNTGLNTILGCTFVSCTYGIWFQDSAGSRVVGCMFDKTINDAILVKGTNNLIQGNTFYFIGDTGTTNTAACVHLDFYGSNQVIGNQFESHSTNGQTRSFIRDTGTGTNIGGFNLITDNYFQINGTLGTGLIEIDANSQKNRIGNNHGNGFSDLVTKTSTYAATVLDRVVLCDATGGAFTVTLPTAKNAGQRLTIKKIDSGGNAITVSRASTDTIEGSTTKSLASQYNSLTLEPDGVSKWYIISSN